MPAYINSSRQHTQGPILIGNEEWIGARFVDQRLRFANVLVQGLVKICVLHICWILTQQLHKRPQLSSGIIGEQFCLVEGAVQHVRGHVDETFRHNVDGA